VKECFVTIWHIRQNDGLLFGIIAARCRFFFLMHPPEHREGFHTFRRRGFR